MTHVKVVHNALGMSPAPPGYTSSTDCESSDSELSNEDPEPITIDPSFGALVLPAIRKTGKV